MSHINQTTLYACIHVVSPLEYKYNERGHTLDNVEEYTKSMRYIGNGRFVHEYLDMSKASFSSVK